MHCLDPSKTCLSIRCIQVSPFLVRIFVDGVYNSLLAAPSPTELSLYTWRDATLIEIVTLVLSARSAPQGTTRYALKHVFSDPDFNRYQVKDLGVIHQRDICKSPDDIRIESKEGHRPPSGSRTLDSIKFAAGDFLDISFLSSLNSGAPSLQTSLNGGGMSIRGGALNSHMQSERGSFRGDDRVRDGGRGRGGLNPSNFGSTSERGGGMWTRGGMGGNAGGRGRGREPIARAGSPSQKNDVAERDEEMQY